MSHEDPQSQGCLPPTKKRKLNTGKAQPTQKAPDINRFIMSQYDVLIQGRLVRCKNCWKRGKMDETFMLGHLDSNGEYKCDHGMLCMRAAPL